MSYCYVVKTILIIFSVLLTQMSLARIGETPDECTKRYGEPHVDLLESNKILIYRKAGLDIIATFRQGRVGHIRFIKSGKFGDGYREPMSTQERWLLLEANSAGREWKTDSPELSIKLDVDSGEREWANPLVTTDGVRFASYDSVKEELSIYTDQYETALESELRKTLRDF